MLRELVFPEVVGLREARDAAGVHARKRLLASVRQLVPREVARCHEALAAVIASVRRHFDVDDARNLFLQAPELIVPISSGFV